MSNYSVDLFLNYYQNNEPKRVFEVCMQTNRAVPLLLFFVFLFVFCFCFLSSFVLGCYFCSLLRFIRSTIVHKQWSAEYLILTFLYRCKCNILYKEWTRQFEIEKCKIAWRSSKILIFWNQEIYADEDCGIIELSRYVIKTGLVGLQEFLVKLKHTHTNPISSAMEKNVYLSKHIRTHYTRLLSEMVVKVVRQSGALK